MPRPSSSEKMIKLPFKVSEGLKPLLEKLNETADLKKERNIEVGQIPFGEWKKWIQLHAPQIKMFFFFFIRLFSIRLY